MSSSYSVGFKASSECISTGGDDGGAFGAFSLEESITAKCGELGMISVLLAVWFALASGISKLESGGSPWFGRLGICGGSGDGDCDHETCVNI
jgi:hypothetical protein